MPTARQFGALIVLWAVATTGAMTVWFMQQLGLPLEAVVRSIWLLRGLGIGALAGVLLTPIAIIGQRAPRTWPIFAARVAHGSVLGPLLGFGITLTLLWIWPNENFNERSDAWKWSIFFWKKAAWYLVPACMVAGSSSVWIASRLSRPRVYKPNEV